MKENAKRKKKRERKYMHRQFMKLAIKITFEYVKIMPMFIHNKRNINLNGIEI